MKDQALPSQAPATRIMNARNLSSLVDYEELRHFDLFSNFTNDELQILLRGIVYKTYQYGRILFIQGGERRGSFWC
ncbi:MAG: hypothetical protein FD153_494 [Rhodospirillaceae bacterium]|nr:MAG: hypothetical protein FD153_494 [Rhodospirillaceae bacterium]